MRQENKNLSQGSKIQEVFLNHCRKNNISVDLDCDRAKKLNGYIVGFDRESIVFESDGQQSLIYKNCIKSIEPNTRVNFILNERNYKNSQHRANSL